MLKKIHVVFEASAVRAEQARLCYSLGYHAEIYSSVEELLAAAPQDGIVLVEDRTQDGGVARFVQQLAEHGLWLPVIAASERLEPHRVVQAIKGGALEFLQLPICPDELNAALGRTEQEAEALGAVQRRAVTARTRLSELTAREREVLERLAAGSSNKMIARDLDISPRTVEIHRANMMAKLGASHAADAVRLRLEAAMSASPGSYGLGGLRLVA